MKFVIFGLGSFGSALAKNLVGLGHEVIGADNNMSRVDRLKDKITQTICLDVTDRDAVVYLPLRDADAVIVAIGEDEASSLLTTALLKQLKVKRIIGRVVSDLQRTVLEAMEIDEYILPEEESAERLAMKLSTIGVIDIYKLSDNYSIVEAVIPKSFIGKTVAEADLINKFGVIVLTTIKSSKKNIDGLELNARDVTGLVTSTTRFAEGDILVLFGESRSIQNFLEYDK
jgi:trk system potassium uptake protein TrkA